MLPQIEINFKSYVASIIERSGKGTVAIVLIDSVSTTLQKHIFTSALDIEGLSSDNIDLVKQCFLGQPSKVVVITVPTEFADAVDMLDTTVFNWLVCPILADQADVVAYAKEKKVKTVVYNQTADDMHVVNFKNTSVTLVDDTEQDGIDYIVRIAGLLAGLPFTRSATYKILSDLKDVAVVSTPAEGQFYLFNDGDGVIRIARAVNSLTTFSVEDNITADFQKITIVECLDIIKSDITKEFKDNYIGRYKNILDNQMLFISAVNGFYRQLGKELLLDANYDNRCEVNVNAQRDAWVDSGKAEAVDWTDSEVRIKTFKSKMFLQSSVKVLDAVEDLVFDVNLF